MRRSNLLQPIREDIVRRVKKAKTKHSIPFQKYMRYSVCNISFPSYRQGLLVDRQSSSWPRVVQWLAAYASIELESQSSGYVLCIGVMSHRFHVQYKHTCSHKRHSGCAFQGLQEVVSLEDYIEIPKWLLSRITLQLYEIKRGFLPYFLGLDAHISYHIINTDYLLREPVQQEESVKRRFREVVTYHQKTELCQYATEHQALRRKYSEIEQSFYLSESMLPLGPLQKSYDFLRKDPTWYLRKELVQGCVRREGCCRRGCGCCKKKTLINY